MNTFNTFTPTFGFHNIPSPLRLLSLSGPTTLLTLHYSNTAPEILHQLHALAQLDPTSCPLPPLRIQQFRDQASATPTNVALGLRNARTWRIEVPTAAFRGASRVFDELAGRRGGCVAGLGIELGGLMPGFVFEVWDFYYNNNYYYYYYYYYRPHQAWYYFYVYVAFRRLRMEHFAEVLGRGVVVKFFERTGVLGGFEDFERVVGYLEQGDFLIRVVAEIFVQVAIGDRGLQDRLWELEIRNAEFGRWVGEGVRRIGLRRVLRGG
ncbi:hypothetical protein BS50DRAFT_678879 [Corynespora cassiicola Philippines]|uniref:Uncharacterized protein n=1 Tax=Corynespora cassiicola Philippines TaxID=1448308 RepID=A0A2T2NDU8_CORCC|nr:hypothetical protein BS50DRAFT_678879 [Corynespora cassiicola Philippines]